MYWNVYKRNLDGEFIKMVKSYPCYGRSDFEESPCTLVTSVMS